MGEGLVQITTITILVNVATGWIRTAELTTRTQLVNVTNGRDRSNRTNI